MVIKLAILLIVLYLCTRKRTSYSYTQPLNYNDMLDPYEQCSEAFDRDDAFATSPEGKSRGVTALLAIVLGTLGIHYFYLGKPIAGIITIILTIVTSGIFYALILLQGIFMFLMHNHVFREKYVLNPSKFPLF